VDIHRAISEGKFREDLFYRLNVVNVTLPSLRQRADDIPLLAEHFLKKYAARMRTGVHTIAPTAMEQLLHHTWPGNVRELENSLQRAIVVAAGDTIQMFQLMPPPSVTADGESLGPSVTIPIGLPMAEAEDRIIAAALNQCGGDKEKAAKLLGISSRTLYRRFSKPGD
jgi:two-component system response regulator HydG